MKSLLRLKRKLIHLRLQPIRVFLFHQVGDVYDSSQCHACDWTQTNQFKANILQLKKRYSFISLSSAFHHLRHDVIRFKRFAVLTNDDGSVSLKCILPWLKEQSIPITLFINGKYLDGISYRSSPLEQYLSDVELCNLDSKDIEIGHHGWEHNDLTKIEWQQFTDSVERNIEALKKHPHYIPFWAYTWGKHTREQDEYLLSLGIVPVLIDGMKNYQECNMIHRELLDSRTIVSADF